MIKKPSDYKAFIIIGLLFFWYGLFLIHRIDLTTADLGRHLKSGQVLLENFSAQAAVLKTNFYSYTQSSFETLNHHWLSGIIFFLVFNSFGFAGVHLFFVILSFLAFWLFFRLAKREIGLETSTILSLLIIPLIAERIEVRPEVFSYVSAGLFLNFLWSWRQGSLSFRWLFFLPLVEILWTNLHLYFILGPVLVGVFLFESLVSYERRKHFLKLGLVFLLICLATLLNPFGLNGSLDPVTIFQNYGYRLLENQSIWFLEGLGFIVNPNFLLFKIVLLLLVLSFFVVWKIDRSRLSLVNICLGAGFALAGALALRNLTIFGLFSLPLIASNLKVFPLPEEIKVDFFSFSRRSLLLILVAILTASLIVSHQSRLNLSRLGLGLIEGNQKAAEFFKAQGLRGPIFNNYDIGGYLVFNLFPQERVFVDNRPEAYSADFFQKEYVPMQESEDQWRAEEQKYGFNAIFFAWHDATPWGQRFLTERVKDQAWTVVYVDSFSIIFVKRNELNKTIIARYEIPKDYFKTE